MVSFIFIVLVFIMFSMPITDGQTKEAVKDIRGRACNGALNQSGMLEEMFVLVYIYSERAGGKVVTTWRAHLSEMQEI